MNFYCCRGGSYHGIPFCGGKDSRRRAPLVADLDVAHRDDGVASLGAAACGVGSACWVRRSVEGSVERTKGDAILYGEIVKLLSSG